MQSLKTSSSVVSAAPPGSLDIVESLVLAKNPQEANLVNKLTSRILQNVRGVIATKWSEQLSRVESTARGMLPDLAPPEFFEKEFFKALETEVGQYASGDLPANRDNSASRLPRSYDRVALEEQFMVAQPSSS